MGRDRDSKPPEEDTIVVSEFNSKLQRYLALPAYTSLSDHEREEWTNMFDTSRNPVAFAYYLVTNGKAEELMRLGEFDRAVQLINVELHEVGDHVPHKEQGAARRFLYYSKASLHYHRAEAFPFDSYIRRNQLLHVADAFMSADMLTGAKSDYGLTIADCLATVGFRDTASFLLQNLLGGNIVKNITVAAPIDEEVQIFQRKSKIDLGVPVVYEEDLPKGRYN